MGDPFAAGHAPAPAYAAPPAYGAPAPPAYGAPAPPAYGAQTAYDAPPPSDYIAGVPKSSNSTLLILAVGGGALFVGIALVIVFMLLR
jgi:hypothetical protein